jgi:hypothetical protein
MAEFCAQCTIDHFGDSLAQYPGAERGDLAGLCAPGEVVVVICEGCGFTYVDSDGRCIGTCWGDYHTHLAHFRVPIERQLPPGRGDWREYLIADGRMCVDMVFIEPRASAGLWTLHGHRAVLGEELAP